MCPAVEKWPELQCDSCDYQLKGLPRTGKCPECGTPIRISIAAHKRRLRQITPAHTAVLLYIAVGYTLLNVAVGLFAKTDLLPLFVLIAPALVGLAALAAQSVNAPRPFHWHAIAALAIFLVAAGAISFTAGRWL